MAHYGNRDRLVAFPWVLFFVLIASALCSAVATPPLVPRFAYVSNGQDDTISIFAIERAQLRAFGYVYVGLHSNPGPVVVAPSQKFLYVASGKSGVYGYSIDASRGTLAAVPGSPFGTGQKFGIAITASGQFLVVGDANGISTYVIDPNSGVLQLAGSAKSQNTTSIAIGPKASFIYAASKTGNTVSVFAFNQESGALSPLPNSLVTVGIGPSAVAIDPFGKFLYATNTDSSNVSAFSIDAKTGVLVEISGSPFPAGLNPVGLAVTKSGKFVFVSNSGEKTVSPYGIDRATGALLPLSTAFPTGLAGPFGLIAHPREPLLYLADQDSNSVRVLGFTKGGVLFNESSIRSHGPATSIALASGSSPVTYVPRFVYESNAIANDIWGYQVSATTGTLAELSSSPFTTGSAPANIVSDLNGRFLFAANSGDGSITAFTINPQTGALTHAPGSPFSAGMEPKAIAVDTDAHYIYAIDPKLNKIFGFAISANGALRSVPGSPFISKGTNPTAMTIDPRGDFLYVANQGLETISVFQINARTGGLNYSSSAPATNALITMAINPDGSYLYGLDRSTNRILCYALDEVTGLPSRLPDSPASGVDALGALSVDSLGNHVYTAGKGVVNGYILFGNNGRLKPLSNSPFSFAGLASSFAMDLSDSFMWIANTENNSVVGFNVSKATGSLVPFSQGPFAAGVGPSSINVVNGIQ
jgi:6-phosphogluconolactonase (cycloisomerase 2 family)